MRSVSFCVRCGDTREGLHVRVVGSSMALGAWSPTAAVPLATTALEFPTWRSAEAKFIDFPIDEVVEYKYVICDNDGHAVVWEERGNRSFNLAAFADKGACPRSLANLTLVESFGVADEPDEIRFNVVSTSNLRMSSSSLKRELQQEDMGSPNQLYPTARKRHSSLGLLGGRAGINMSYSVLPGDTDTIQDAGDGIVGAFAVNEGGPFSAPEIVPKESATAVDGMVREESSSNLFPGCGSDDEAIEPVDFTSRYVLLGNGPLGEGTFGLVWRCRPRDNDPGDSVLERAAKIVRKARLKPHEMEYLLGDGGEVAIHLEMKHKHIVELFEHFDEAHTVALVLEYCCGGDLFDAVVRQHKAAGRGFAEKAAAVAIRHVLLALAYIHERRIVHRDVKCENVLLAHAQTAAEANVFKLCDFGFAKYDEGQGVSDRLGSPDTVAPEVVLGYRYSTPADIWSAGVIVYMMFTAKPPFYAQSDAAVLKRVRKGDYSLKGWEWDDISADPKQLLAQFMTVDASSRISADDALGSAWLRPYASNGCSRI